MALFKTTAEIKKYLPVVGTTKYENLLVFIEAAERDYIIPVISQEQYDDLSVAYNVDNPALTTAQTQLLTRTQAALAQYFFYLWIPTAQLSIGDNGIRIAVTDSLKTAFQWQIDELERSVMRAAGRAMDSLLDYMEDNKADYALWTASDSYTEFKECFITSTKLFTKLFRPLGNSRMNFLAVRSAMSKSQEFDIEPVLGEEFYAELLTQHTAGNLTPANQNVMVIVQKALANLTMKRAFTELSVTIDERGIINFDNSSSGGTIESTKPAKDQMITKLELMCQVDGNAYLQKIRDFLAENIGDYPTYSASDAYDSDTTDTSFKTDPNDTLFSF